jgi:hypothetical protein
LSVSYTTKFSLLLPFTFKSILRYGAYRVYRSGASIITYSVVCGGGISKQKYFCLKNCLIYRAFKIVVLLYPFTFKVLLLNQLRKRITYFCIAFEFLVNNYEYVANCGFNYPSMLPLQLHCLLMYSCYVHISLAVVDRVQLLREILFAQSILH